MATPNDPTAQGLQRLADWIEHQVLDYWPDALTTYRGRGRNGDHFWQIQVPTVGNFWLATTEAVLEDPAEIHRAEDALERSRWLDRLPDVETRGLLVKDRGRLLMWNPEKDETIGALA